MPAISQQPRRLETGLPAKPDVDEDDIRPQRLDTLNRLGGVTGHPGYGHPVAVQQGTGDVEEVGIVIDYHAPELHWTSLPVAHAVRIAASKERIAPSRRPEVSGRSCWHHIVWMIHCWLLHSLVDTGVDRT